MSDHRTLFHVPTPGPYLLSHSVGCLPRSARKGLSRDLLAPWAARGSDAWPEWLAAVDRFRAAIAALLGGKPEELCPQQSVSAALTSFLSSLPLRPGRNVLLASAHSFPSIGFAMKQFERMGYALRLLPEAADPADPAVWVDAIDERVAVVVAMHVHSNSGKVAPVEDIARAARAAGALSIVDICQSVGIVPVELTRWGVDVAIGSCVKWLCGGPGAAYLWVREALIGECEPINVGWFSHADPFAFDIRDFVYAPDARRFWGGTPTIAPYTLATASIDTIAHIGIETIAAANRSLIAATAGEARLNLDMTRRGGTLCLTSPDVDAMAASLTSAGCRFDRRAEVVRLSFHIFNTAREARRVGRALRGHAAALV